MYSADLEYPLWSITLCADQHPAARSFLLRNRLCDSAMAIVIDGMTPIHSKAAREDNQQASEVALSVEEQDCERRALQRHIS